MQNYINQRAMDEELPISIPTAIPIKELLIGEIRKTSYQELWINVRTLVRNLISSLDKETSSLVSDAEIANAVIDEIEIIETAYKQHKPSALLSFYMCDYGDLKKKLKNANFREPTTDLQKFNYALLENSCKNILDYYTNGKKIRVFNVNILPIVKTNAVILTHNAVDLISEKNFNSLKLLESHTGKLKSKQDWHSKFSTDKDVSTIPFNMSMLTIFGDSEVFKPQSIKIRKTIVELSQQHKWSAVTTSDRIKLNISFIKDSDLKNQLSLFIS